MATITNLGKYWGDVYTFLSNVVTMSNGLKSLVNNIRTVLQGDYVDGPTTLAIGSTATNVKNAAFSYYINGAQYDNAATCTALAFAMYIPMRQLDPIRLRRRFRPPIFL